MRIDGKRKFEKTGKNSKKVLVFLGLIKKIIDDIKYVIFTIFIHRQWEQELTKSRKLNRKPRLRNALFRTFWMSCIVDGLLVLIFTLLKSIMPVFLAQLLIQFQLPPQTDNSTTTVDNYEMTTVEITTIISNSNDDDDGSISSKIFQYMLFIW